MAKNKIQFQSGYSPFQLYQDYGTEQQCHQALYKCRWPSGNTADTRTQDKVDPIVQTNYY